MSVHCTFPVLDANGAVFVDVDVDEPPLAEAYFGGVVVDTRKPEKGVVGDGVAAGSVHVLAAMVCTSQRPRRKDTKHSL